MTPGQLLLIMLVMALMGACEGPVLQCPNTTIEGKDGDTVILPCSTKDKTDISLEKVEWLFEDPPGAYKTVHVYFQNKDVLQKQSDDFKHRTSLFKEELSSGNCSLSLQVNASHSGRYYCHVLSDGQPHCIVDLKVLPKGKNNTSQNLQEGTPSPDNPKNGTDKQPETSEAIGGVGGVIGGIAALCIIIIIIIALVVYCCCKHLYSGRKPNNPQPGQTQQPPQDRENEPVDPNPELIPLNPNGGQGAPADGNEPAIDN